eukprot:scaffold63269_cov23-Prasinocladus_malaysianus.AAC.1
MEARHARINETRNMKTTIRIKIAERCPLYVPYDGRTIARHTGTVLIRDIRTQLLRPPCLVGKHTQ